MGFPGSSVGKESACNAGYPSLIPGMIHWRWDRLCTPVFLSFPCGSTGKESACNEGDLGSIPGLGRSSGEGKGSTLPGEFQGMHSKSRTRLSDLHFTSIENHRIFKAQLHMGN